MPSSDVYNLFALGADSDGFTCDLFWHVIMKGFIPKQEVILVCIASVSQNQ